MTYADLVRLFYDQTNALQGLWTLYVVILGGLLAFASLRQGWSRTDILTTLLVTILFVCFAYKNLGGIHDKWTVQTRTLKALKSLSPEAGGPIRDDIEGPMTSAMLPWENVRNFHVICDVLGIAALWGMHRRRRLAARVGK